MERNEKYCIKNTRERSNMMSKSDFQTTVEALLTDTLIIGQLYLRPPCLKPRFNSHTNSVFLHSRKRTFFLFLSSHKRKPERKSTTSVQYLVFINEPFYIAVRHNDFTVITVPYFNVCFVVIHIRLHLEAYVLVTGITTLSAHCSQGTQVSILAKAETF